MTQGYHVVVLDSGGCSVKIGLATQLDNCKIFPNCTAKVKGERGTLVGEDILSARDVSSLSLRRPVDRGYVTAWDAQKEIWSRAIRKLLNDQNPATCGLILTEPYLNLPSLREAALQVAFDDLGFGAVYMTTPAALALRLQAHSHPTLSANTAGCGLVVDAGFSYTHAVPLFDWRVLKMGIRRIDLGGKALTNYMKELVSYRSINMMDETYLLEYIKDKLCFVSQDTTADLVASRGRFSKHRIEYLLPDGVTSTWGEIRPPQDPGLPNPNPNPASKEAVLIVNNERFMVPEALFHPTDIGMEEAGLAETIVDAISSVHPHLRGLMYSNIILTGGTARCPGFKERLLTELRPLVPDDYELGVYDVTDPVTAAWQGGALFGASGEFGNVAMTRVEWKQHGVAACAKWLDG